MNSTFERITALCMSLCVWMSVWMICTLLGCGCGSTPKTHHYRLTLTAQPRTQESSQWTLGVEHLTADAAYDDVRMVYRKSAYRLDYYHYHRWSAPPGVLVTDMLRQGFQQSGYFRAVVGGFSSSVDLLLRGRLLAIEEVDVSKTSWKARLHMDLRLQEMSSGKIIWSKMVRLEEKIKERTPEGLARALSEAVSRSIVALGPEFIAAKQQSQTQRTP